MSEIGVNKVILIGRTGPTRSSNIPPMAKRSRTSPSPSTTALRTEMESKRNASSGFDVSPGKSWQRSVASF